MNHQSTILCHQIGKRTGSKPFNIFPLITHCALDIICETAMGENLNSQEESDTDYVRKAKNKEINRVWQYDTFFIQKIKTYL